MLRLCNLVKINFIKLVSEKVLFRNRYRSQGISIGIDFKMFWTIPSTIDLSVSVSFNCIVCVFFSDSGFGTIYVSDDRGTVYSKSLERHLYTTPGGETDFTNVTSLRGVFTTSVQTEGMTTFYTQRTYAYSLCVYLTSIAPGGLHHLVYLKPIWVKTVYQYSNSLLFTF